MRAIKTGPQQADSRGVQRIPCDLTIKNVRLVNVITGEIYPAQVDVLDGVIVRVRGEGEETLPAASVYDGRGGYLLPGFIDIHMHVESTMLTPEEFGNAAVLCGTTAVFVDPHEIANVMGIPGVEYMLKRQALPGETVQPGLLPAFRRCRGSRAPGRSSGPGRSHGCWTWTAWWASRR